MLAAVDSAAGGRDHLNDVERTQSQRAFAIALAALLGVGAVLAPSPSEAREAGPSKEAGAKKKPRTAKQKRPNIVVVMTDDQDIDSVRFMPQLQSLVTGRGVTFQNSIATYPLCCPSRATFLTGQYSHNHRVHGNDAPIGGYPALAPTLRNSLPVWLQRSGYYTAHIGKFLNRYETMQVPPGWNEWYGSLDNAPGGDFKKYGYGGTYTMYGYLLNENGKIVHYGTTPGAIDGRTYQTDVYTSKAVRFIRQRAPEAKPFFLSVASLAPHVEFPPTCSCGEENPRAAPRHEGAFAGQPLPKPPSFDEADISDKPSHIQLATPIGPAGEASMTKSYRDRIESLLAVDDMVGRIVGTLKKQHELNNTVILFTSDNGWLQGEHRWRYGKVLPYEESIRVPLMIRGPGVPQGESRTQLVANIDLASTILDFADAKAGRQQDGRSLVPLLHENQLAWNRPLLLGVPVNASYVGVRTDRYMYARYASGEEELYDLQEDPFELQSLHDDPASVSVKASMARLLSTLQTCAGRTCG